MISSRIKIKVQSVKSVKDMEGRECFQIDFVEVRQRPPVMMMTNPDVPNVMPGMGKDYEQMKLTLILTGEELESFRLKPYPNMLYELSITDGTLNFTEA